MKKELYQEIFKNKRWLVMGLGLLGRGIGDTKFLGEHGAVIVVTDKKNEEELKSSLEVLREYPQITYHLGGHIIEDFKTTEYVLKSAGVPYDSEYITSAKNSGAHITMSASLVASLCMKHLPSVVVIGVTGTRGKSTTTMLIAHTLRVFGEKVHLGGNVRGVANLPLLHEVEEGDVVVFELDSWQLQGFHDEKISPHIAIFTNFMDDHMNYYHNDVKRYFYDKASIYRHQQGEDVLYVSKNAEDAINKYEENFPKNMQVLEGRDLETKLLGKHNQVLLTFAYETAKYFGYEDKMIRSALASFSSVEGRLEVLGTYSKKKITVINDNNATTGDAVAVALHAVNEMYHKKPILIVGGADKGLPLETLKEAVNAYAKSCVYLEGTGTTRLLGDDGVDVVYHSLKECVDQAFEKGEDGDVILFSPGFASFSHEFRNEYERNDAFLQLVKAKE